MASKILPSKQLPCGIPSILDPSTPYKPSTEGVDVRDTWKKYGWVSPQAGKTAQQQSKGN